MRGGSQMRRRILIVAALCIAASARAQNTGQITGTVTSAEDGRPLAGANITVVGTVRAAITDAAGKYVLTLVPVGRQSVRARDRGFASALRPVEVRGTRADGEPITVDFRLVPAPNELEGLVTTAYYGEEERRNLTDAISILSMEELRDVPLSNPAQMLQARAPGVDVVTGGEFAGGYRPGAPMNVRIRGIRSITASNEPLYVVDGLAIGGFIQDFNPSSIASIEALKDAAATAPYGSAGANGVILITTNRGASGSAGGTSSLTYDFQYGVQTALHLADMMTGPQLAQERLDAARLVNSLPTWSYDNKYVAYCALNVQTNPTTGLPDTTAAGTTTWQTLHPGCSTGTDWQRAIYRTGSQQQHRLSYNSASGTAWLSLSGTYFNQSGITLGQGYHQYAGTMSLENTFGRLRVGATATGSRSVWDLGGDAQLWSEANANSALGAPYDSAGTPKATLCSTCTLQQLPTGDPLRVNPLREAQGYIHQHSNSRLVGAIFAELQLGLGFRYRVDFGSDLSNRDCGQFQGANVVVNNTLIGNAQARDSTEEDFSFMLDNVLMWDLSAGDHQVEATVAYGVGGMRNTSATSSARNLPYDSQLWYNLGTGAAPQPPASTLSISTSRSWMGRVNYVLARRYSLSVTGRYDGSSILAPGRKWAFFPSVGLAWQIGDESFMKRFGFVSGLKLRASLGTTGNSSVSPYETEGSLTRTLYNFGSTTAAGYVPGSIPNADLTWEKTTQLDVGVDFGVFRNRIAGTFDVYREKTSDLLLTRALPASTGFTSTLQNVGKTGNAGWELSVSAVNLTGNRGGPRWTTELNLTHNQNYIISLAGGVGDDITDRWFLGQPINVGQPGDASYDALHQVFYDVKMIGIWQLADSLLAKQYGEKPGDIRIADLNGDGKIDGFDRVITGNTYPRLIAGVYNRVSWGRFDLSLLLQGRIGYTFQDGFRVNTKLSDRSNDLNVPYWTPERCDGGPNPLALDPPAGVTAAQQASSAPGCNAWWSPGAGRQSPLYDDGNTYAAPGYRIGTHWRVRNITLGFTLPGSVTRLVRGIGSMRIYIVAQDPFVFTSYYGYDPEAGTSIGPPSYRTLLVGTTLGF